MEAHALGFPMNPGAFLDVRLSAHSGLRLDITQVRKVPTKSRHGALSFSFRKWLGYLACAVDEKPGNRADRAVLQGNDSIRSSRRRQFNGQDLKLRTLDEKSECGGRENCDETAGRQQADAHMRAIRDHAHLRISEPA